MLGSISGAFRFVGQIGLQGVRELVRHVEINPWGSTWGIPQATAKVCCLVSLYFAKKAHTKEVQRLHLLLAFAALVTNYSFRKLYIADSLAAKLSQRIESYLEADDF